MGKESFLKAEREEQKGNYSQRMHCFRQDSSPKGKRKGSLRGLPLSADPETDCWLVKGHIPEELGG